MPSGRPRKKDPKGHSPAGPLVIVERDERELTPAVVPEPPTRAILVGEGDDAELEERQLGTRALVSWDRFWLSPVVVALDAIEGVDRENVERWARAIDELDELERAIAETGRIVRGSMGQPVNNPLLSQRRDVLAEIRRYEEVLGLTPRDRASLGIEIGTAKMTAERLNAALDRNAARRQRNARK